MQTARTESNDLHHFEDELLRGNFREALRLSNQQLREWQQQNQKNTNQQDVMIDDLILRLDTHVDVLDRNHVTDESLHRRMSVHFGLPDRIDRAASIALQSWYELSKLTQNSDVNTRQRYLQPFLEVYTSTNEAEKSMPLELFVVWLKFCHTLPNVSLTMELAGEVLHRIRWGEMSTSIDAAQSDVKNLISELTISLFTEWLPKNYCSNLDLLEDYLRRLQSSSNFAVTTNGRPNLLPIASNDKLSIMKKAIQMCLQYCNTDDGNYPEWLQDSFVKCRKVLQAKLREIYHHKNPQDNQKCDQASLQTDSVCHIAGNCNPLETGSLMHLNNSLSLRTLDSWKTLGKVLCDRTRQLLQQHVSMERQRQAQMFVLLLLIGLGYSWRYRNRSSLDVVKSVKNFILRKNRPKINQQS